MNALGLEDNETVHDVVRKRNTSKSKQSSIEDHMKKEAIVDDIVAEFFYSSGIPFNVVRNPLFEV